MKSNFKFEFYGSAGEKKWGPGKNSPMIIITVHK